MNVCVAMIMVMMAVLCSSRLPGRALERGDVMDVWQLPPPASLYRSSSPCLCRPPFHPCADTGLWPAMCCLELVRNHHASSHSVEQGACVRQHTHLSTHTCHRCVPTEQHCTDSNGPYHSKIHSPTVLTTEGLYSLYASVSMSGTFA